MYGKLKFLFFFLSENCRDHKGFRLHGIGSCEPSKVFHACCSRTSSLKACADWALPLRSREVEGLISRLPDALLDHCDPATESLGHVSRMYSSFIQNAIGQVVPGLQPALAWIASWGDTPFWERHWKKQINWKPLMSREAWTVVRSTLKSLSQVLLRYFGLYK